jgi:uncharacterized protein (UPF0332 family)
VDLMATWKQIGVDSLEAAKMLLTAKRFRSAVSRSYYAAFSMVNEVLECGGFMKGLRTPSHLAIPKLIEHTFATLSLARRRNLKTRFQRLYALRIGADYQRGVSVNRQTGLEAVRLAGTIMKGCRA